MQRIHNNIMSYMKKHQGTIELKDSQYMTLSSSNEKVYSINMLGRSEIGRAHV